MERLTDKRYTNYREFNNEELWATLPFLPTLREVYLKLAEYEDQEEKQQNKKEVEMQLKPCPECGAEMEGK